MGVWLFKLQFCNAQHEHETKICTCREVQLHTRLCYQECRQQVRGIDNSHYLTLWRPHLQYQFWVPQDKKDVDMLQEVEEGSC